MPLNYDRPSRILENLQKMRSTMPKSDVTKSEDVASEAVTAPFVERVEIVNSEPQDIDVDKEVAFLEYQVTLGGHVGETARALLGKLRSSGTAHQIIIPQDKRARKHTFFAEKDMAQAPEAALDASESPEG